MAAEMHVEFYEKLQREDADIVLLVARQIARDDLAVEERLAGWGRCACRKHWDALLLEVSDVLPEYRAERRFEDGDHVVVGEEFRVRLPGVEA